MLKALALDAVYQVLDNKVFRVLMILVLIPILVTFLIGFREDGISILFGAWHWTYQEIIESFGNTAPRGDFDYQGRTVSALVSIFVDFFGGTLGIVLAIAATAFFVPRMLEKGSADVLFHKPINRFALYLSRYFAGLIFIALVAAFAVTGMYLGLIVVSGYNDPGILWAAVTLTYTFGLIHCVSMLIGVMTRSTVASILVTLIFFMGNGCVHKLWITKEQTKAYEAQEKLAKLQEDANLPPEEAAAKAALEEDEDEPLSSSHMLLRLFVNTLDALHFVLPKTSDAGYITHELRASVGAPMPFVDPRSRLSLRTLPDDLAQVDAPGQPPPVPGAEAILGQPAFAAERDGGAWRVVLWSRDEVPRESKIKGKDVRYAESTRATANKLAEAVQGALGLAESAVTLDDRSLEGSRSQDPLGPVFAPFPAYHVTWTSGDRSFHVVLLESSGRFHALELSAPASAPEVERARWTEDVLEQWGVRSPASEEDWYGEMLGWRSELKFNIAFSIGSSLAFAAAILLLGGFKLSRLDF
jgi:ABC-type transport system involved in multi-copper enzyme maturation permease subunit